MSDWDTAWVETVLRDADTAMYQAKLNGKGGYVVFDPSMNERIVERVEIETGLRRAVENEEFRVYYQPIIDLETGQHQRSRSPCSLGTSHAWADVSPAKFIPIAEETGLIVPIGTWVLAQSCRQAKIWQEESAANRSFIISVNLSGSSAYRTRIYAGRSPPSCAKPGLSPASLKLEITESVMMENLDAAISRLKELKALGVLLSVDDFGTGYSSLSYLQRLPIDNVKIDRSFVNVMGSEAQPRAVVEAIIMLCRAMNLNVTGEGIENSEQLTQLKAMGCDYGQGYLFAKPIVVSAFSALLNNPLWVSAPPAALPPLETSRQAA